MLLFSIALHISAIAMTLVEPSLWRWMLGAIVANHALLTALAMQPRGRLLGLQGELWSLIREEAIDAEREVLHA